MSIKKLRTMLDNKEISAVELTEQYLKRIEEKDKDINSFITLCHESAIENAKKAQAVINSGKNDMLTGIPVSVKDNICTLGIKTTCASKMLEDFIPPYDATAVEKLKRSNAVILGKTNMDEFSMGGSSQTSYFGGVKNPYDLSRIPGGSSGGSAASVSADFCVASLGSDTGGSIRQPSAFCGVTGIKPTYGSVSRHGLIAFASSLDQIGIVAKSAEDTAYILDCIHGYDEYDATSSKRALGNYTSLIGSNIRKFQIGIPTEFFSYGLDDEVKTAVLNAIEYYKAIGCEIVDCSIPSLEYALSAYYIISSAEAASNLSRYDGIKFGHRSDTGESYNDLIKNSRGEGFGMEVKKRIMLGNYALSSARSDEYYKNALRIRAQIKLEYDLIFEKCDVVLTPTTPTTAHKLGEFKHNTTQMYLEDIYTVTANLAGLPAISTTCGYDKNGLPIGMTLTGKAFHENTIIAVCDRFEKDFIRKEAVI